MPQGRFIPAGAGNTWIVREPRRQQSVHPRWRGEHATGLCLCAQVQRFIPAGAGNTRHEWPWQSFQTVHPRWRGEHS